MNQKLSPYHRLGLLSLSVLLSAQTYVYAQVIPDNTLSNESSSVSANGNQIFIQGGATRGNNLFHSFRSFSIRNNKSATFNINDNIANIFSRITGQESSTINGLLSTSGNANLFLINPNGITIGPNARLDINASFLATTSNQFVLNSGHGKFDFLSNTSIPRNMESFTSVDLVFNNRSQGISLKNFGHSTTTSLFAPLNRNVIPGFEVSTGKTLALFGTNIISDGGIFSAPSGNLIVGSISKGTVNIQSINGGLEASLGNQAILGDLSLLNRSLLNANAGGRIDIYGRNINIFDGSTIYIENLFNQTGGSINILASEDIRMSGFSPKTLFRSSIFLDTIGTGVAPIINVKTKNLFLSNSAFIGTRNFIAAQGGEINVDASGLIEITKPSLLLPAGESQIASTTNSSISSADVTVNAKNIFIEGSSIASTTLSSGNSGDVTVNASESIVVSGLPTLFKISSISASTFGTGNGGNVSVRAKDITLSKGGAIASTALAQGNAGSVEVTAANSISLFGLKPTDSLPVIPFQTTIDSNASIIPTIQAAFGLSPILTGDSGQVSIVASKLFVSDGATIGAFNQGKGIAGNLTISSNLIELIDSGTISVSTLSGRGGNIQVLADLLILKNGVISAAALGDGIGGNIGIDADLFLAFENSRVSANAINAQGGNITFNTIGFFPSPNTNITATSALGAQFDGTIAVNNPDRDLELAISLVEPEPQTPEITSVCTPKSADSYSEFVLRGDGGLPTDATNQLTNTMGWHDPSGGSEQPGNTTVQTPEIVHVDDAQGWVKNPDGTMSLVAYNNLPITKAEKPNNCNAKIPPDRSTATYPQPNHTSPDTAFTARPDATQTPTARTALPHTARTSIPGNPTP